MLGYMASYYFGDLNFFRKVANRVDELMKTKAVIYLTDPSVRVKRKKDKLVVGAEEIPLSKVLGAAFIYPESGENPQRFLIKGVPSVAVTKGRIALNLPSVEVAEENLTEAYRRVCNLIGNELQRFFTKYLTRRGAGFRFFKRGRFGTYSYGVSQHFVPLYKECFDENLKIVKRIISAYLKGFGAPYALLTIWATALFYANAVGIPTPKVEPVDLITLYAAPVYYLYQADYVKSKTFNLTEIGKMPPRGQVYTALNYLIEDLNLLTTFTYNLTIAKRFLK